MKKLLCLCLSAVILFGFSACGKTEDVSSNIVDNKSSAVIDGVAAGKIPEVNCALGTTVTELKDYYKETEQKLIENHQGGGEIHSDDDVMLNASEGELSCTYEIGYEKYYFEKEKKKNGVSVVCSLSDAFGMKIGATKSEVEAMLSDLELESIVAGEDELYFVPLMEAIVLRYTKDDYQLDFYFNNNELVATVLKNVKNWTI